MAIPKPNNSISDILNANAIVPTYNSSSPSLGSYIWGNQNQVQSPTTPYQLPAPTSQNMSYAVPQTPAAPTVVTQPKVTTPKAPVVPGSAGSITPTPIVPTPPVTPTPPAGAGYTYQATPEEIAAQQQQDALTQYYQDQFNQQLDPNQIYQNNLRQYQSYIDSINNVYNDQLNQARVQGAGRLESRKFAQGRAGQIGSGTGEGLVNAVQDANAQEQKAIDNQRLAAIQAVLAQVRNSSADELAAKTKAKSEGADALVKNLASTAERRKTSASAVAQSLIAQGIDISQLSPEELDSITSGLKVSPDLFKSAYASAKTDNEKATLENDKLKNQALPASAQEYEYAKSNGYKGSYTQYQNEDANRKARAAGGNGSSNLSQWEYQVQGLRDLSSVLSQSADQNSKLTPAQYKGFKKQFIENSLGDAKTFDANFGDYIYVNKKDKTANWTYSDYGVAEPA